MCFDRFDRLVRVGLRICWRSGWYTFVCHGFARCLRPVDIFLNRVFSMTVLCNLCRTSSRVNHRSFMSHIVKYDTSRTDV